MRFINRILHFVNWLGTRFDATDIACAWHNSGVLVSGVPYVDYDPSAIYRIWREKIRQVW